jgi:cobalt/nickel transport system permease protein
MPHHLDLYLKHDSPLHRLDTRAKLIALAGFVAAALAAPSRPAWPLLVLCGLLAIALAVGRVRVRVVGRRLLPLVFVIGAPFLLTRLGDSTTQAAGESFAARSLLVAGAFLVLVAVTKADDLLETIGTYRTFRGLSSLGEFILRGTSLLLEEVVRTNRAWALRAPDCGTARRLAALTAASVSLLGRAAARSDHVGAAMVLRGFDGTFPPPRPHVSPPGHLALGAAYAFVSLLTAGVGRWL